jgi:hypothetical protein
MNWYAVKLWLEHATGLDMDALHVHAGVALQLLFALILRRPLSSPWPWLGVAAAEALNEYNDLAVEAWPQRGIQIAEGARDYWNTLLIPTLLLLLCRYAPWLLSGSRADAGQAGREPGSGGDGTDEAHQG